MASNPGLQRSKSMDSLILFQRHNECSQSFISLLGENELRMRIIPQELRRISDRVKVLHSETKRRRLIGGAVGAFGVGLGVTAVGGLLLGKAENTQKLILGVPAILASSVLTYVGFKSVYDSNSEMMAKEREMMETADRLTKEFKNIIEPQKTTLEELKNVMEEINERSAELRTTAGPQADATLSEFDSFLDLVQQIDESAVRDRATLLYTQLVSQCEKTYEEPTRMRDVLRDLKQ